MFCSLLLSLSSFVTCAAERPPNIVLILADDLGYGDVACFNPQRGKIPTPQLDRLASEGIRFTDCHSASSVCSPTRYNVLTGRYAWRTRLQAGVLRVYDPPLIAHDRLTLPALLRKHGYDTACIGKWHLGWSWPKRDDQVVFDTPIPDGPTTRGFDHYFGTDVPNYPPYCFIHNDRTVGQPTAWKEQRDRDGWPGPELPGWRRDAILPTLVEETEKYLAERAADKKPFFLYFPLTSPHEPIAPTEQFRGKSGISPVADFIMETDWAVGRTLQAVAKNGLAENTLVIFTADNGHCVYTEPEGASLRRDANIRGHYPSAAWRGFKADIWEGGHRVPTIVRWPGRVRSGATSDALVSLGDWIATCAELLQAELPETAAEDSISFLPVLLGRGDGRRESLISHSGNGHFAIRKGEWKLIFAPGSRGSGALPSDAQGQKNSLPQKGPPRNGLPPIQLYNLATDPGETCNLQADHPDVVRELTDLLQRDIDAGRSTPGPRQSNDVPVQWKRPEQTQEKATARPRGTTRQKATTRAGDVGHFGQREDHHQPSHESDAQRRETGTAPGGSQ